MEAIKTFVEVFFTIPSSMYLLVPFTTFGQFAHAFIVLVKLASLEVEGWDMKDFHDRLDFSAVIEEAATRFDNSGKASPDGMVVNNESFSKWAYRMRWMKQVYEGKFSGKEVGEAESADRGNTTLRTLKDTLKPPDGSKISIVRHESDDETQDALPPMGIQQVTPPEDLFSSDVMASDFFDESFWQGFGTDFELGFEGIPMGTGIGPMATMGMQ